MEFPSKTIEKAVEQFKSLPGIGNKTALRLVLSYLKKDPAAQVAFEEAVNGLRERIVFCSKCHNLSDEKICGICSSPRRNASLVCVVQDVRDVLAIESTAQFDGLYHILGSVISPMDGVGPSDLNIDSLMERIEADGVNEVIFALSATMEGDTTIFYLAKKLKEKGVKMSTISRGVAVGGELEYVDEVTLGRSIAFRVPYQE